jgi:hypothetical protein
MEVVVFYASKSSRVTKTLASVGNVSLPMASVTAEELRPADAEASAKLVVGGIVCLIVAVICKHWVAPEAWVGGAIVFGLSFVVLAAVAPPRLVIHTATGALVPAVGSIKKRELSPLKAALEAAMIARYPRGGTEL